MKGRLLGLDSQALQVRPAGAANTLSVPLDMLQELQIYRGSQRRTGRGAWVGFAAGAVVGAVGGVAAVATTDGEFIEFGPEVIPVSMALAGGAGALVGAAIGVQFTSERWGRVPPPWAVERQTQ